MGDGHEYGLLALKMGHGGNIFSSVCVSHRRVTLSENDGETPGADRRLGYVLIIPQLALSGWRRVLVDQFEQACCKTASPGGRADQKLIWLPGCSWVWVSCGLGTPTQGPRTRQDRQEGVLRA